VLWWRGPKTAETRLEHDRASFGNRMMWAPIVLTPFAAAAGTGGVIDKRLAKTALAIASLAVVADGVQGTYLHYRGIAQRPGGWRHARYTYSQCHNDRALMALAARCADHLTSANRGLTSVDGGP